MSSRTPQLRQSFLVTGAAVALVLVTGFALLSSRSASRIVERQANARGQDLATHVASLVDLYLRERRHEAEALAGSPAVVRAALEASQAALRQRLPQLDIPTLERMFNQRRELGGDPDLAAYLRGYAQHSDFAELFFTESHGYNVLASDRTSDFVQSDEAWWQQAADIPRESRPATARVVGPGGSADLVVTVPTANGKWWVVFREPERAAYAVARTTATNIVLWTIALFGAALALLVVFWRRLNRRVTEPVKAAGAIASRVAGGDLSVTVVTERTEDAEVGDLLSSVHSMVVALRRLVGAIRTAADEAAAMATEISASTEEMSASTEEMSATCQDLTKRAAEQAQLVRSGADDATKILQIATILAAGAEDSVRRNTAVADVARRNKEVLDESTEHLAKLAEEVNRGGAEAEALARASAEIQKFVTQAKTVATQTNMLALNAAIEAARAGPQGRGFAVVADEVRKLASVAAAGATETADTVRGVLGRVQAMRDRLTQLAHGTGVARSAAQTAAQGLGTVAAEAQASDVWGREIAKMAGEMRTLVEEISARLGSVAQGTETLLASAEEIAASSEQQSASTQEIASSANQLAEAADKLTGAVKSFRLLADEVPPPERQAAD